ncbi:MAG: ABC transporter permease [Candidatus Zixiibacteriota bacterium]|nr:MAG: ABC transporter permease [candidate division Zixibacteria bacterium]
MFSNYLKIALRGIRKQRGYTFINVAGLAIGLACCMLISLWILDELGHDKHYAEVDRIHAILANGERHCPNALAPFLQDQVPEIEYAGRTMGTSEVLVSAGLRQLYEEYLAVDPSIIDVFELPFISGDSRAPLADPNSIVITQKIASRFFPEQDAVGEILSLDNDHDLLVTGVVADMPHNSTLQFDMLVSIEFERQRNPDFPGYYEAWNAWGSRTYVRVQKGVTAATLTEKISDLANDQYDDEEGVQLSAINIADLYFRFSDAKKGVTVFAAIAIAILTMACVNFTNLSTARHRMRSRETGIRKVVGARRGQLVMQFLGESFLLTIIGFFIALIIVELVLPSFNALFQMQLSLSLMNDAVVILVIIGVLAVTALAAGAYPALLLSRYHPALTLRKGHESAGKHFTLRRVLVVFQFALTIFLVAGTAIVYTQINHIKGWDVGYNKEQVINIPLRGESRGLYDVLKNEMLTSPEIISATGVGQPLPYWHMFTAADWEGRQSDDEASVSMNFAKYDYARTYGIKIVEGRDFSTEHTTDLKHACLINETLARLMNLSPIIGADISVWGEDRKVIGVLEDFNFQPLNAAVEPLAIMMIAEDCFVFDEPSVMSVRISGRSVGASMQHLQETWERLLPDHPFEYSFLDEEFDAEYRSMEQMRNLAGSFGLLAVFIACLGLFGLASYTAEQRTKEIGIRKVLGATVTNIVGMLSKEFVVLVAVSNIVAWPLAWFVMKRWLEEFAYRAELSVGLFFMVGCFALIVALLSVGYQAIRAARANPVDAIVHE